MPEFDRTLAERGFAMAGQFVCRCLDRGRTFADLTESCIVAAHRSTEVYGPLVRTYGGVEMPGGWALAVMPHATLRANGADLSEPCLIVVLVYVGGRHFVRGIGSDRGQA